MTAINVLVSTEYASLITDTLARTDLGPDFHVSKTFAIPHMRLAIATRGPIGALEKASRLISQASFDFASARAFLGDNYAKLQLTDAEIFLAGWDVDKPAACMISSANTGSKILDIPYVLCTPTVSPAAFAAYTDNPIAGMPALLQAQAEASSAVGGFINVTQVGSAVIESYSAGTIAPVRRWAKVAS